MGLFDKKQEPIKPPSTESEVRNMVEHSDLASAIKVAPTSNSPAPAPEPKRTRQLRTTQPQVQGPTAEDIEKARRKSEAMKVVGTDFMREIAEVPYEFWAFFASDPELRLTDAESKKLADSYFYLAQNMDLDFSKSWLLIPLILMKNKSLVTSRFRMLEEKENRRLLKEKDGKEPIN